MPLAMLILLACAAPAFSAGNITGSGKITGSGVFIALTPPSGAATYNVFNSSGRQNVGTSTFWSSTFPAVTTSGDLLGMVIVDGAGGASPSVVDDAGNVWKSYTKFTSAQTIELFYSSNSLPAHWIRATYGGAADTRSGAIFEISGITQSSATDKASGTFNSAHMTTSTMSISGNMSVYVCGTASDTGATVTYVPGNGYSALQTFGGGSNPQLFLEVQISTANRPCDSNWDSGASTSRLAGDVWR